MSHGLWQRQFGGAEDLIGRRITIDGVSTAIVGVMPPGFGAPSNDLWRPLRIDRASGERGGRSLTGLGRLADGQTIEAAGRELTAIASRLALAYPAFNGGWGVTLEPLEEAVVGPTVKRRLYLLLGAAAFLLLIACVNVANLQSVRAFAQGREVAIRTALGASRWRITRQLLIESLVLAIAGGVLGLFVAVWGRDLLLSLTPAGLPRLHEVDVDWRVLGVGAAVALTSAMLFGLVPGLRASRAPLDPVLRGSSTSLTASSARLRGSSALVVLETSLAFVLLVGAGLLIRSFLNISAQEPGFEPDGALTFQVGVPQASYPDART